MTKKAGELRKSFFVHGLFIALIVIALVVVIRGGAHITGDVVLDSKTAQEKLESALSKSSVFASVLQSSMCIVINDKNQPISFQVEKTSAGWTVLPKTGFCKGLKAHDVVVQFPDYDSFSSLVNNPSPKNIAQAAMTRDFEILESKYIELGGNVKCDATFKVKYCGAISAMATPEDLIDGDLVCCLNSLSKDQKKQLEEHLQDGRYEDEIGLIKEKASGGPMIFGLSLTYIGIGGFGVLFLIIFLVVITKGKGKSMSPTNKTEVEKVSVPENQNIIVPIRQVEKQQQEVSAITELRGYVSQTLMQGYVPEDLRGHLLSIGWDQPTTDKIIMEEYERLSQQIQ